MKILKMLESKKTMPVQDENEKEALQSVIMELKKYAQELMAQDLKGRSWKDDHEEKEAEMPEGGLVAKVKMAKLDRLENGDEMPDADEAHEMLEDESMTPGADAVALEEKEEDDGDDMDKLRMLMKKKSKDGESDY